MKRIAQAYPWILLAPVVLPVAVASGIVYPYLVPKTLAFYAISFTALSAFALLMAYGQRLYWSRLEQWDTWIPGALLALAYIASLVGIDFYRSFWSIFVRGDGLLMLTCAVASYYLIILSADHVFFKRLLQGASIVGSVVAIYGIGEWLIAHGRIGSLLGNAAFFAGYLGITLPATLIAARLTEGAGRKAALIGAFLQLIAIALSATRGTMLALVVATGVALIHLATRAKGKKKVWATRALIALVLLGGAFFTFRNELAKIPFEPIARIASISFSENDVASRLFVWKNMLHEIGKSPFIGVGAEHIDVLFNRFYDPSQISEEWFDRSHNAFLDYAAEYGIAGLVLYLMLILSFVFSAMRFARTGDRPIAGLFTLLAIVYAVQNFFVFDTVSSLWLLLALLAAFTSVSLTDKKPEVVTLPSWARPAAWGAAVILILLIYPVSVKPAKAAYDLAQAYGFQQVNVPRSVQYLQSGFALGTYGDLEYGYEAYDMYANHQAPNLSDGQKEAAYTEALSILTADFNRYPYDARTALYLAHVLSLAPQGVTIDQDLLSSALARAIKLSPKRAQPWYILTNLTISRANAYLPSSAERAAGYAAARGVLTKFIELVPDQAEPHFVLAELLYATGDVTQAKAEAGKGKTVYRSDLETAKRAAGFYETVMDLPNAEYFLTEIVRLDPTNIAAQQDLAKIQAYERANQ